MCIFCKIIKGEIPSYKIYEDEYTYAFLDIAKDVDGHTLVIPKKHVENVLDCDNETLRHVIDTAKLISNYYVNECGYDGVNILNANDASAQQSVFHLHFHIIQFLLVRLHILAQMQFFLYNLHILLLVYAVFYE
jgi:histidine triad (HIT) family protein